MAPTFYLTKSNPLIAKLCASVLKCSEKFQRKCFRRG